jgi:hypothetical protein
LKVFEKEPFLKRFASPGLTPASGDSGGGLVSKLIDPHTGHTLEPDQQLTQYPLEHGTLNLVLQRYCLVIYLMVKEASVPDVSWSFQC